MISKSKLRPSLQGLFVAVILLLDVVAAVGYRSTKSATVNARSGPGQRYKLLYTYSVRHFPLRVLKEYHGWSYVQDIAGDVAWVNSSLLCDVRTAITQYACVMYKDPQGREIFAYVRANSVVRVKSVDGEMAKCAYRGKVGYIKKNVLWGIEEK